ncbi:MAG: DMT family transporter [Coriobacteriales bacterium]|jgi:drug/metabolite transporter (DMT)-like permease
MAGQLTTGEGELSAELSGGPSADASGVADAQAAVGAVDVADAQAAAATQSSRRRVPQWVYKLGLLSAALIWGSSFFVMKDTLDVIPPNLLLAIRFTTAAVLLMAALHRRVRASLEAGTVARGLVLGVLVFVAYCVQTVGLTMTTPGKNAFLTGVYCVLVPFVFWAVDRTRPGAHNVAAALLCVAGIGLVSLDGSAGGLGMGVGDALTLLSALFYAVHIVATAVFSRGRDVFALTAWQFVGSAACAWAVSLAFEEPPAASAWTPATIGALAYLAVACTCVALLLQNVGTKHVEPSSAALLLSLESPSGVLFSVLFAGEVLTPRIACGFALIFLAIVTSETRWAFLRRPAPGRGRGADEGGAAGE